LALDESMLATNALYPETGPLYDVLNMLSVL
jgi:hypothetical protein